MISPEPGDAAEGDHAEQHGERAAAGPRRCRLRASRSPGTKLRQERSSASSSAADRETRAARAAARRSARARARAASSRSARARKPMFPPIENEAHPARPLLRRSRRPRTSSPPGGTRRPRARRRRRAAARASTSARPRRARFRSRRPRPRPAAASSAPRRSDQAPNSGWISDEEAVGGEDQRRRERVREIGTGRPGTAAAPAARRWRSRSQQWPCGKHAPSPACRARPARGRRGLVYAAL